MNTALKHLTGIILLSMSALPCYAETPAAGMTLPDFYAQTPVERVQSEVVQAWPRFTFLESVLSDADGSIWVTDHLEGKLYHLQNDQVATVLDIDGELLCLSKIQGDADHIIGHCLAEKS